jgi:hypothetical protein
LQQTVKLEIAQHEQHDQDMMKPAALVVSLKNLRSLLWELTSSSGRGVKNNNYHDHDIVADQALIALEVVESQWLQRESELEQERMEIRQMAITFKQVQIIIQTLPAAAATSLLLSLHFSCLCNGSMSFSCCCCCCFLFGKGAHRQVLQPSCSSLED